MLANVAFHAEPLPFSMCRITRGVIEEDLLRSADRVARRLKVNRSALIRDALRGHLQRLRTEDLERLEREAYERTPDDPAKFAAWDGVAAWPGK